MQSPEMKDSGVSVPSQGKKKRVLINERCVLGRTIRKSLRGFDVKFISSYICAFKTC